jgi:riboflavin kinase/FMN adenylyltransferase
LSSFQPSALTIGNFDGVHIGHQHLIAQIREGAVRLGVAPSVLTFDPHPACVVAPDRAPRLLTSIAERTALLERAGVEQIFALPFTREIAKMTPEEFVRDFVAGTMRAKLVVVGENFRFGHKQSGDTKTLAELGSRYGFETLIADPVTCRGRIVSSSLVRGCISGGDVKDAWRLLARPYSISGDVVHGRGIGSKQTVPTLNLRSAAQVLPKNGVYVTRTRAGAWSWHSITNIGVRPTFEDSHELSIETFLLSPFDGETPAKIEIEFLHRVRDERKFESPEALKAQIMRDVARARSFFRHSQELR